MEISVEGSELVIKNLFSTKRYPLCEKLRVDWGDSPSGHQGAIYDVYKEGVPMCMDDEEDARCLFDGYLKPDELHLLSLEIVMPIHIAPAQGIYELAYLPKERADIGVFEYFLAKMKEKGVVSMEKYRYLESE